ncbi:Integral peroxisomal membrane peroxin [Geosmithia morbida]|uniref:Integral peroxisomal membrane peroxin n=1 Tax=Geosmithia morbida TaxID=1094350 RepID=A0A9P5D429_9HYPO|nr:Integral peroxisomal membrane peroxin [Geosmithia morbida]KAF4121084.1 Integral peroxisomal membrane peroxin [Geosmithia morbida]
MDDFTAEILASGQDNTAPAQPQVNDEPPAPRRSLRSGFAARASIQDRLVEKLLQQVVPVDDDVGPDGLVGSEDQTSSAFVERPNFNLTTMSNNFRRFNARIGVVFKFQAEVIRLLSWHRPSQTMSLLAVYTFVCLDPYLLSVLPMVALVLGALVPGFLARHPAPPKGTLSSEQGLGYSAGGPPLAPAATVRPVKELSKDFFRNMRDLQNVMEDFSVGHDQVVSLLVPLTNFSDEALSSAVFLVLVVGGVFMTITAHLLPWRFIALALGWAAICSGHPGVSRLLAATHRDHLRSREEEARSFWDAWVAGDVILDSAPETREVEVFELQRVSDDGSEWEPWLFTPSPYDPLSQPRISGDRPRGTRFFDDVLAPEGWQWSEKKWALDLWSREWVEERIITGVEVETEGERWVYDMYDDRDDQTGVVEAPEAAKPRPPILHPSWEEGEDSSVRRGRWRRRRWVRLVKRKATSATTL